MMQFDDLGLAWKREGEDPAIPANLDGIRARAEGIDRAVRRRDTVETAVALALAPVFAGVALITTSRASMVGAVIVAVACLLIPVRLWRARHPRPDRALPVARTVEAELAAIRSQQRLLGSVAWWYLTPLGIGVVLFFAGAPVALWMKIAYGAVVAAVYTWILRLNLLAVRRNLDPVASALEQWLRAFRDAHTNGASDA